MKCILIELYTNFHNYDERLNELIRLINTI